MEMCQTFFFFTEVLLVSFQFNYAKKLFLLKARCLSEPIARNVAFDNAVRDTDSFVFIKRKTLRYEKGLTA